MPRRLPTRDEALRILAQKRTRPVHRPPSSAGRALRTYIRELDARFGQGTGALTARWREVVGPEIARRTEPVKLVKGRGGGPSVLEVRVAVGRHDHPASGPRNSGASEYLPGPRSGAEAAYRAGPAA